MGFSLIRPASRAYIAAARTTEGRPVDADRAASALRGDVERWSRWALGVLGFVLSTAGSFVAVGMMGTLRMLGGAAHPLDVVIVVAAAVVGLAGLALLIALWLTGRRLVSAATWWLRLPYRSGARRRRAGGWLAARTVNFEPRVFVRIASSSLALLIGVCGVAVLIRDLAGGLTNLTAAAGLVGAIGLAAGVGQGGGVMRMVSAVSEADPLWVRIRSVFVRS